MSRCCVASVTGCVVCVARRCVRVVRVCPEKLVPATLVWIRLERVLGLLGTMLKESSVDQVVFGNPA